MFKSDDPYRKQMRMRFPTVFNFGVLSFRDSLCVAADSSFRKFKTGCKVFVLLCESWIHCISIHWPYFCSLEPHRIPIILFPMTVLQIFVTGAFHKTFLFYLNISLNYTFPRVPSCQTLLSS